MINKKIYRELILPAVVPVGVIILTGILVVGVGESLLALADPDETSELRRLELWVAVAVALVVLFGCAFLATRPKGSLGRLDEELAIGSRPMLAPPLPPVDVMARQGSLGTLEDIRPDFRLFARNGELARVVEVMPQARESYGHLRRGLIYAQGMYGANDELWIPGEAVAAVYPETNSAFLAIAGDEIEYLGWHRPPVGFRRTAPRPEQHLY
jgi:hypothetical protein